MPTCDILIRELSAARIRDAGRNYLILVLDNAVRAVSAAGSFRMPLALIILILNRFRMAGDFLLAGGRRRGGERLGMGGNGSENAPFTL